MSKYIHICEANGQSKFDGRSDGDDDKRKGKQNAEQK